MEDQHKQKCPVKMLDCCFQGKGHSKYSKFQLFVQMMSSESQGRGGGGGGGREEKVLLPSYFGLI